MTRAPVIVAAAALAALTLTGCDTSPVAASVNGSQIKQTALNSSLRYETQNKAFVTAYDAQQGQQGQGATVAGASAQTLSVPFVDGVLTGLVQARAVHDYVVAHHVAPSAAAIAAARAVEESRYGNLWFGFPAAWRDSQVMADAERAAISVTPPPAYQERVAGIYSHYSQFFFSSVCVRTIAVAVTGADGLDRPATDEAAARMVDSLNGGAAATGGQVACYDGAALEAQGPTLFSTVVGLPAGHAAPPVHTSFGDRVVVVDSRVPLSGTDPVVGTAIEVALEEVQNVLEQPEQTLLARAHVSVNPQYGTWDATNFGVVPASAGPTTTVPAAPAGSGGEDPSGVTTGPVGLP